MIFVIINAYCLLHNGSYLNCHASCVLDFLLNEESVSDNIEMGQ